MLFKKRRYTPQKLVDELQMVTAQALKHDAIVLHFTVGMNVGTDRGVQFRGQDID